MWKVEEELMIIWPTTLYVYTLAGQGGRLRTECVDSTAVESEFNSC